MAWKDRIESFVRHLYNGGKNRYSKQEIIAAIDRGSEVRNIEGIRELFEKIPDHEYDEISLTNAVASLLARDRA